MLSLMRVPGHRLRRSSAPTTGGCRCSGCGKCPTCTSHALHGLPQPISAATLRAARWRALATDRRKRRQAEVALRVARTRAARTHARKTVALQRVQTAQARLRIASQRLSAAAKHFDRSMRASSGARHVLGGAIRTYGSAVWKYLARELRCTPQELPLLRDPEVQRYACSWCCDMVIGWFLGIAAVRPMAPVAPGGPAADLARLGAQAVRIVEATMARCGVRPPIPPLRSETLPDSIVVAVGPRVFDEVYRSAVAFHALLGGADPGYAAWLVGRCIDWVKHNDVRASFLKPRPWRDPARGRTARKTRAPAFTFMFPVARRGAPASIRMNFFLLEQQHRGSRSPRRPRRGAYLAKAGHVVVRTFPIHRPREAAEARQSVARQVSRLGGRVGLPMRVPPCLRGTELHTLIDRLDVFRQRA
jgi:hypothetical protein